MKWVVLYMTLALYRGGVAVEMSCDCFVNYRFKNHNGESYGNFSKNVEHDSIHSYQIGFSFSNTVREVKVYDGYSVRVNDTLWFIRSNGVSTSKLLLVTFPFRTNGLANEITRLTFNGDTICQVDSPDESRSSSVANFSIVIALVSIIFLVCIILVGLIILLMIKLSKNKTLTEKHWQEVITQVVGIQRLVSPNNPNNKYEPLPPVPASVPPLLKRGTYIELEAHQCTNTNCSRKYNTLLRAFDKIPPSVRKDLKFFDKQIPQGNDYIVRQPPIKKQDTL